MIRTTLDLSPTLLNLYRSLFLVCLTPKLFYLDHEPKYSLINAIPNGDPPNTNMNLISLELEEVVEKRNSKSDADSKNRGAPTSCLNQEASPGYSTSSLPSTSWNAKKPKDVIRKKRYSRLQKPL
ncbi:hypothetical protein ZEAMMB73_Zm00001d014643 [Zea mays]|uniref:Uncharacterized protein n=1 Tax=Zea mays TaxID=4577 RepID=A0A1D6GUT6_MAIZE|nr:hypothetical protein ZEAMMB73_Zm00001d014643 [Zea mays]